MEGFILLFLVLIKGLREEGQSKISLCYPGVCELSNSLFASEAA